MTDAHHTESSGGRLPRAGWRTLATAMLIVSTVPHAMAAQAPSGPAADRAESGPGGGDPVQPPASVSAGPSQMGPVDTGEGEAALYGPPSPKVSHGKLADIEWPEAPPEVPPALETAINIVTRNYPSAKSGRAALRAAASDVKAAKWLRFPSLNGNISYLDKDMNPDPQLVIEQPIWTGGRIGANIRRARAAEDSSSADYVSTVEDLALTTAQTYFEIARLTLREQLLADSLKEHERLVQTMERRVAQEVSPQADLELARSRAAQIEQDYTISRSQRETALRVLAELVADPSYDLGPVPYYDPAHRLASPEALEDQAAAFDPKLRGLEAQADIARAELDTRKASVLPQLNAQYSYDDVFGSRVGLVVRAQGTGGLTQFSEINSARLRIQSALEDRRQAEQQLRREIASDLIEYDAAKARASISTRASATAARVSESYVRQFIAGRRSWLDVMNALREAVTAELGKTDAEISAMSTAVRLLIRSGRWQPRFDAPGQPEFEDQEQSAPDQAAKPGIR